MDDKKIIDLYFNRDESAIPETSSKYGRLINSIAYNILKNITDSEECENDGIRFRLKYHAACPLFLGV